MPHLFVYGSLAPGRANADVLADIPGQWRPATVTGTLHAQGWGAALGFPGLVLDPHGEQVRGFVFTSDELPAHWQRLDEFEGEGYLRLIATAYLTDGGEVEAHVYCLAPQPDG